MSHLYWHRGVGIWPALTVNIEAVKESELEDQKVQAAKYSLDNLDFNAEARVLFDALRPQIMTLGEDVIELCGPKSVSYCVHDFFVEVLPRKRSLLLNLNLDFDDCDDPTQRAKDAAEYTFVTNASRNGGVLFRIESNAHIAPGVHLVRQAYEKVSE